jgi:hypothetical protein
MRACSVRVATVVAGVCALLVQPGAAQRTPAGQAAAALTAVDGGDPLELARVAARLGDDAVLALLAPEQPARVRIAAVRAAPWLREPERALAQIAAWVSGRDSELAPAAARAALRIARALDADALARREVAPAALTSALAALLHAAELAHVRQDLQRMAAAAAAQLVAAGVPAPAPPVRQ